MSKNHRDDNTESFVPLTIGSEVGHYKIIEKIGAGGMGEVYLAEDTKLKRQLALKFLPHHYASDKDLRERFTREAQAAAKLDHPNIVPVYEVGEYQGRPYFAMAHIDGKSLREVIKEGKLRTDEAVSLTMQICEGLYKAHKAGVVHRDVKPSNIVIDSDGRARLVDFGLAHVTGAEKLTETGSTLGTLEYMSPEQVEGKTLDARSDLYSLGVVLYEMIAGRRPFTGKYREAILYSILHDKPEPLARYKTGVSDDLQRMLDRTLEKDVDSRYPNAAAMLADLKRLQMEWPRTKKSKLGLWVAAAVIIIIGGYFGFTHLFKGEDILSTGPKRLVVLPFNNLGDSTQAYFASGMTDEIINRLTSIENLQVVARRSAAKLKAAGVDISVIGKELGVEYVLDVSTLFQESSTGARRVKLVTQLIKVSDESVLWGKTYDTVMTEIFAVQSMMAERVAEQLGVVLSPEEKQAVWEQYTDSPEAWDYYLRGNRYHDRGYYGPKRDMVLAIAMYKKAIELDPSFDRAYSQISRIYSRLYITGRDRSDSCRTISREMAETAIELSSLRPGGSGGHRALGYYYMRFEENWDKALKEWEIAYGGKEVAYDNPWFLWDAHMVTRYQGRWQETYEGMKRVVEAEPKVENAWFDLGVVCHYMRNYEEAEEAYKKAISLEPDWGNPIYWLYTLYIDWQGDTQKARDVIMQAWDKVDTLNWVDDLMKLDIYDGDMEQARKRVGTLGYGSKGWLYKLDNKVDTARIYFDSSIARLKEMIETRGQGEFGVYRRILGANYARMGNRDSAMHYIQEVINLYPFSKNQLYGLEPLLALFDIYVNLGELDSALVQAEMLLCVPAHFDIGLLLLDPDYEELIKEPGFARVVREYGNDYHKRLFREIVGAM